jgi:hypothetical protein
LASARRLKQLYLNHSGRGITGEIAQILKPLKGLELLAVLNTGVTPADLPKMKKALPNCQIEL